MMERDPWWAEAKRRWQRVTGWIYILARNGYEVFPSNVHLYGSLTRHPFLLHSSLTIHRLLNLLIDSLTDLIYRSDFSPLLLPPTKLLIWLSSAADYRPTHPNHDNFPIGSTFSE